MAMDLKSKAYRFLRGRMIEGRWSNEEVYSTVKIAKNMGMSFAPVREAIVQLETEGLIEKVENRGIRPKRLNREELCDLFQVREAMEIQAAILAIQRAKDEEFQELRSIFTKHRQVIRQQHEQGLLTNLGPLGEKSHQYDVEFHLYMVAISRSKQILKIITDMHILSQVMRSRGVLPGTSYENYQASAIRFHYRILRALECRDEQVAADWVRKHIRHAREYHLALYDYTHQNSAGDEADWPGRVLARISKLESDLTTYGKDSDEVNSSKRTTDS